nr:LamB/YcsF family protein [Prevotella sp.]
MITQHEIVAVDGSKLAITPDTICVHGDGVKAVAFVKKIH